MIENCPNCGTRRTTIDAFCSECRCPLDEPAFQREQPVETHPRGPARQLSEIFTLTGRILVIATILLAVGGTYGVIAFFYDTLPPGRYPLWFFGMPVWVGSGLLFVVVAGLLTRMHSTSFAGILPRADDPLKSSSRRHA